MSKLLKVKEWLTLDDAAKKLSISFEESLNQNDILQLCLNDQLKLSCLIPSAIAEQYAEYCSLSVPVEYLDKAAKDLNYPVGDNWLSGNIYDNLTFSEKNKLHDMAYELYDKSECKVNCGSNRVSISGLYTLIIDEKISGWLAGNIVGMTNDLRASQPDKFHLVNNESEMFIFKPFDSLFYALQDDVPYFFGDIFTGMFRDDPLLDQHGEAINKYFESSLISHIDKFLVIQSEHLIEFKQVALGEQNRQSRQLLDTTQLKREQVLRELINQRDLEELKSLGRLGVWRVLTDKDKSLFPPRDDANVGMPKDFFKKQNLIAFKRGR